MAERRRDNRGRILRNGESQRKDGRYVFSYFNSKGKRRFLYSWRLDKNDRTPAGVKRDLSLREKEFKLQCAIMAGLNPDGADMTVTDLVEKYISTKTGVRSNTRKGYKTTVNYLKQTDFGDRKISSITVSDAKLFLIGMQTKDGKSFSSIHSVRGVLNPAFRMAYEDDLIKKNPFNFELKDLIKDDSIAREAINQRQERLFLEFVKADPHYRRYYEGMYILFKTGLRISEFCGLTEADLDMKRKIIHVTHQLLRNENSVLYIEETKTGSGTRDIPMTENVYQCFVSILEKRRDEIIGPEIDGKKGFLFLDKNGKPTVAMHWEKYFHYALGKYNRIYKEELPLITPHVCRHTFITSMVRAGMSLKQLQYLAGHSEISITLDIYTHMQFEDVEKEVHRIEVCSTE